MKSPKIIYFLLGSLPTDAERQEVDELGVKVAWRNVQYIDSDHFPEECDGVAGLVPENYADKPTAVDALAIYNKYIEDRQKLTGDVKAPETVIEISKQDEAKANIAAKVNPAIKPPKSAGWSKGK